MARFASQIPSWNTAAIANTTALTDGNHHTIQGGSGTQRGELRRIYLAGQGSASAVQIMVMGRTTTAGTTLTTVVATGSLDPATAALAAPATCYSAASTDPGRHTSLGMLIALGFNAYGGIVNWQNGPDEIVSYLGSTVAFGELSLNAFTGTTAAAIQSNIVFEVL